VKELRELYEAIKKATMGRQVQSVGHRGRQIAYAQANPDNMIKLYRQLRDACPRAAEFGLPDLKPSDVSTARRGPPARFVGGY
jgi:radical SAM superfamily enzyme with C-terminal helix-hairpin-helix motif